MSAVHIILGLFFTGVGTTTLMRRDELTRQEAARGRVMAGRAGWTVVGGLFAVAGLFWLIAGVA